MNADAIIGTKIMELCSKSIDKYSSRSLNNFDVVRKWLSYKLQKTDYQFSTVLDLLDKILRLKFLEEHIYALLDSVITTPYFLKLSDVELFSLIIENEDISKYCVSLKKFLFERCITCVKEMVVTLEPKTLEDIYHLINNKCKQKTLKFNLFYTLLVYSQATHSVISLLTNPLWHHFIKIVNNSKDLKDKAFLRFKSLVDPAINQYERLANDLINQHCSIEILKLVFKHKITLLKISAAVGDKKLNQEILNNMEEKLSEFEHTLDLLQTFLTIFCEEQCFNVSDLLEKVLYFKQNLESLAFNKLIEIYQKLPIMNDLIWFYELRGSELFLEMWKKLTSRAKGIYDIHATVKKIVPTAKRQWRLLYDSLDKKSITFTMLEIIFKRIAVNNHEHEIKLLKRTFEGEWKIPSDETEWVSERVDLLKTFTKLCFFRKHIPSMLNLISLLQPMFVQTGDKDYESLKSTYQMMNAQWSNQTLDSLTQFKASVIFFDDLTTSHLQFLGELSKSEEILIWLKKHKSQKEFNNLLGVCKSYTDNVRVIEALSSLVTIRTILIPFLYSPYLFSTLERFKCEIVKIDLKNTHAVIVLRNLKVKRNYLTKLI